MAVYGLLLIASKLFDDSHGIDCVRIFGLCSWHTLMPGHNGLFARRLPIASTCFEYTDIHGFGRRRFDLFAIKSVCLSNRC